MRAKRALLNALVVNLTIPIIIIKYCPDKNKQDRHGNKNRYRGCYIDFNHGCSNFKGFNENFSAGGNSLSDGPGGSFSKTNVVLRVTFPSPLLLAILGFSTPNGRRVSVAGLKISKSCRLSLLLTVGVRSRMESKRFCDLKSDPKKFRLGLNGPGTCGKVIVTDKKSRT